MGEVSEDRPTTQGMCPCGAPADAPWSEHSLILGPTPEAKWPKVPRPAREDAREDALADALRKQMEVTDELARLAWEGTQRCLSCFHGRRRPCGSCAETHAYLDSIGYGPDVRREKGWQR